MLFSLNSPSLVLSSVFPVMKPNAYSPLRGCLMSTHLRARQGAGRAAGGGQAWRQCSLLLLLLGTGVALERIRRQRGAGEDCKRRHSPRQQPLQRQAAAAHSWKARVPSLSGLMADDTCLEAL
jgi:hypothetical protein